LITKVELLLIRGLPGSGKTTMTKQYAQVAERDALVAEVERLLAGDQP
jgi:tRNA uridine 5-carbamoylmethylation protein Kti12